MSDKVAEYLTLTRDTLPRAAKDPQTNWPVSQDHCFQRIVLDAISGGVWYDYIAKPAYKHLTATQANAAVDLCKNILSGDADVFALNAQSLAWRKAAKPALLL